LDASSTTEVVEIVPATTTTDAAAFTTTIAPALPSTGTLLTECAVPEYQYIAPNGKIYAVCESSDYRGPSFAVLDDPEYSTSAACDNLCSTIAGCTKTIFDRTTKECHLKGPDSELTWVADTNFVASRLVFPPASVDSTTTSERSTSAVLTSTIPATTVIEQITSTIDEPSATTTDQRAQQTTTTSAPAPLCTSFVLRSNNEQKYLRNGKSYVGTTDSRDFATTYTLNGDELRSGQDVWVLNQAGRAPDRGLVELDPSVIEYPERMACSLADQQLRCSIGGDTTWEDFHICVEEKPYLGSYRVVDVLRVFTDPIQSSDYPNCINAELRAEQVSVHECSGPRKLQLGPNYVRNPGFEDELDNWNGSPGARAVPDVAEHTESRYVG
jgi:hypothetical protein